MVLDPKIAHNDYGSFESGGVGGGGGGGGVGGGGAHLLRGVEVASAALPPGDGCGDGEDEDEEEEDCRPHHHPHGGLRLGLHGEGARLHLHADMTQSDLYQRQPLLPPSAKNDTWAGGTKSGGLHSPSRDYYDVDPSSDGLAIHRNGGLVNSASNGMVQIEMPAPLREEPRFPKEKWKTFVAFLILVVNFLITVTSLAMVHERVPDRDKYGPLPDIFLDNVPAVDWALSVSEVLIVISVYAVLIVLVFHKHRFIVMRRVFVILALLYLMRSITMFVTVLPVASVTYYCSPKMNSTSTAVVVQRMWQLFQGFGLSINGKHTYCGDYIYSGHTVMLTMSYLIIAEYSPKRCFPVHWISWIVSVTGVILVLVAHGHYTVDVIIAYYATTTLFWIYHTLANNPNLKQHGPNNFLARCWWFPFFQYFERNVGGPVPRQYEWPLPWPRWCHGKHPNRNSYSSDKQHAEGDIPAPGNSPESLHLTLSPNGPKIFYVAKKKTVERNGLP